MTNSPTSSPPQPEQLARAHEASLLQDARLVLDHQRRRAAQSLEDHALGPLAGPLAGDQSLVLGDRIVHNHANRTPTAAILALAAATLAALGLAAAAILAALSPPAPPATPTPGDPPVITARPPGGSLGRDWTLSIPPAEDYQPAQ